MKVVVQRVLNSSVVIDDKYEEKINKGLMILLGTTTFINLPRIIILTFY